MKLYLHYIRIHIKSIMQYKVSFILTVIGQFLVSFNVFLGIYFMFDRFHAVEGYNYSEVLLCFSVVLAAFTLAECFFRGFDVFPQMIGNGEFDRVMVRPRNEIYQVLCSKIELTRVGRLLQAVAMIVYAVPRSGVNWTAERIFLLFAMILCGSVIFAGIFLIYAALCFFTLQGLEFMNVITDGAREYGKYPVGIYGKGVLRFCTYIIPFALVQYYPFLYLIGRTQEKQIIILPFIALLFLFPCYIIWRVGIRHYKSTGS